MIRECQPGTPSAKTACPTVKQSASGTRACSKLWPDDDKDYDDDDDDYDNQDGCNNDDDDDDDDDGQEGGLIPLAAGTSRLEVAWLPCYLWK